MWMDDLWLEIFGLVENLKTVKMDCLKCCYQVFSPSKNASNSVADAHYTPTVPDSMDKLVQNGTEHFKNKIQGFIDVLFLILPQ